jgi:hypothetical protein
VGTSQRTPIYAGKYSAVDPFRTLEEILADRKEDAFSPTPTRMAQGGHVENLTTQPGTLLDLLRLLK